MILIMGNRMKKWMYFILAVCGIGILCFFISGKKDERFQTTFPLEEEAITDALEKAGLPGTISESETESYREGHISYVVRDQEETYEGTDNSVLVASLGSATYEGERMLLTVFDQRVDSEQMEWEDWKRQIVCATLLYGGFENEEDVYQAFLEKELPDEEASCEWKVELPEGYCRVTYSHRSNTSHNEDGFPVEKQSATLRVNIYESCELYQKMLENQQADSNEI